MLLKQPRFFLLILYEKVFQKSLGYCMEKRGGIFCRNNYAGADVSFCESPLYHYYVGTENGSIFYKK
jgi:hypothetical protein